MVVWQLRVYGAMTTVLINVASDSNGFTPATSDRNGDSHTQEGGEFSMVNTQYGMYVHMRSIFTTHSTLYVGTVPHDIHHTPHPTSATLHTAPCIARHHYLQHEFSATHTCGHAFYEQAKAKAKANLKFQLPR